MLDLSGSQQIMRLSSLSALKGRRDRHTQVQNPAASHPRPPTASAWWKRQRQRVARMQLALNVLHRQ